MTEKTTVERIKDMPDDELIEERGRVHAAMQLDKSDYEAARGDDGKVPVDVERDFLVKKGRLGSFLIRLDAEMSRRRLPVVKDLVNMNAHMLLALDSAAGFIRDELELDAETIHVLRVLDEARMKARANADVRAAAERFAAERASA